MSEVAAVYRARPADSWTPQARRQRNAADAVSRMLEAERGRGLYQADRVAALGELILQATHLFGLPHNAGRERAASALRRLADVVERGGAL